MRLAERLEERVVVEAGLLRVGVGVRVGVVVGAWLRVGLLAHVLTHALTHSLTASAALAVEYPLRSSGLAPS